MTPFISRLKPCVLVAVLACGLAQTSYASPDDTLDPSTNPGAMPEAAGVHFDSSSLNRSAGKSDPSWAKFASNSGNSIFLAAGTLLPLVTDGKDGAQHTYRIADALVVSTALTSVLKVATHEQRPDGSDYKSFPSGHASAAFTVATMEAHYHPRLALLWYAGATAIGASRVALDRHYWHDVVAGAAIGYFTARLELRQKHGLLLRPLIHDEGANSYAELQQKSSSYLSPFIHDDGPDNRVTGLSFTRGF